jgi:hypothetical protein
MRWRQGIDAAAQRTVVIMSRMRAACPGLNMFMAASSE